MKMTNLLKKNYATVAIMSLALVALVGCTKDPKSNHTPTVKVPSNVIVNAGEELTLNAKVYDKDKEDELSYLWRIAAKPKNSQLTLKSTTTKSITFKADQQGTYYFDFVANDEISDSKSERVILVVSSIIGEWTADLKKTKNESKLSESETAELVETLSSNYKYTFQEGGKVESSDDTSWTYLKNGNYQLNGSKKLQLTKEHELYIVSSLKSGKEIKFYYKRAIKK